MWWRCPDGIKGNQRAGFRVRELRMSWVKTESEGTRSQPFFLCCVDGFCSDGTSGCSLPSVVSDSLQPCGRQPSGLWMTGAPAQRAFLRICLSRSCTRNWDAAACRFRVGESREAVWVPEQPSLARAQATGSAELRRQGWEKDRANLHLIGGPWPRAADNHRDTSEKPTCQAGTGWIGATEFLPRNFCSQQEDA